MSGSRVWFIAAAACLIVNIVLVWMPVDALNAIGALFLIAAVVLAIRGVWVLVRSRRAVTPHDV